MTRDEHMAWCKKRALEYLPGDPQQAVTSMLSDLRKHPETTYGATISLLGVASMQDATAARKFIQGFN